jgi:hypothetical protein
MFEPPSYQSLVPAKSCMASTSRSTYADAPFCRTWNRDGYMGYDCVSYPGVVMNIDATTTDENTSSSYDTTYTSSSAEISVVVSIITLDPPPEMPTPSPLTGRSLNRSCIGSQDRACRRGELSPWDDHRIRGTLLVGAVLGAAVISWKNR